MDESILILLALTGVKRKEETKIRIIFSIANKKNYTLSDIISIIIIIIIVIIMIIMLIMLIIIIIIIVNIIMFI